MSIPTKRKSQKKTKLLCLQQKNKKGIKKMKKKLGMFATSLLAVVLLAGCSSSKMSNDYITINRYKGLKIKEVAKTDITDKDVNTQIQSNLSAAAASKAVTDRAVENGDIVNIDYSSDFENGSDKGYDLEIGSNTFIGANGDCRGFEEQIIGHRIGETFDIKVQFPADYQVTELQNAVKTFSIKINSISEKIVPELTDEWVAANSKDSKIVEEYKKEVRKALEKDKDSTLKSTLRSEILAALLKNVEVKKYPDKKVEEQAANITKYYKNCAEQYRVGFADFLEQKLGMTEEEFAKEAKKAAKQTVKQNIAVQLIADKKDLVPSDKEYEKSYKQLAKDQGYESVDALKKAASEDTLKNIILQQKVADYLLKSCTRVKATDSSTNSEAK